MKHFIGLIAFCSLFWVGCTEKPPNIIMTPPPDKIDTTYVLASTPATQPHNILIENFTGASCTNCPAAHDLLHGIELSYPGRINIVSLYIFNFAQTTPPPHAKYDFRTQISSDILKSVYGTIAAMPAAGIDRHPLGSAGTFGSDYLIDRNSWSAIVIDQLTEVDSLNLDIESAFDDATGTATVTATVTYLKDIATVQNLTIALVEDDILDAQEYPTYIDTAYKFTNVLRDVVTTGPLGDQILPNFAIKEKNRVYKVSYNYKVKESWKPENCRVVAFVHKGAAVAGNFVYQSQQAKLKP